MRSSSALWLNGQRLRSGERVMDRVTRAVRKRQEQVDLYGSIVRWLLTFSRRVSKRGVGTLRDAVSELVRAQSQKKWWSSLPTD